MKKHIILTTLLALCLGLAACGSKAPSLEEVEAAIRDGSVTIEDALDKGWVTQEWVDDYLEEGSVPAADKVAINAVGEFETETISGDAFTNRDIPGVTFLVFLDPEDAGAQDFYDNLTAAVEGLRSAGADVVVCNKGAMDAELFQDAPFPVVAYNDSMKAALGQNDSMASDLPCTGVWYINGSLLSAWVSQVDADDLVDSADGFVSMAADTGEESGDDSERGAVGDSQSAVPMG